MKKGKKKTPEANLIIIIIIQSSIHPKRKRTIDARRLRSKKKMKRTTHGMCIGMTGHGHAPDVIFDGRHRTLTRGLIAIHERDGHASAAVTVAVTATSASDPTPLSPRR
jgi:hypothetical protein